MCNPKKHTYFRAAILMTCKPCRERYWTALCGPAPSSKLLLSYALLLRLLVLMASRQMIMAWWGTSLWFGLHHHHSSGRSIHALINIIGAKSHIIIYIHQSCMIYNYHIYRIIFANKINCLNIDCRKKSSPTGAICSRIWGEEQVCTLSCTHIWMDIYMQ